MADGSVKPVHAARPPDIPGAHEADGKSDLAAGGARQELAQPYKIGICLLVEPAAAHDELFSEIPDVSDGPTEAGETQLEEDKENFNRRTCVLVFSLAGRVRDNRHWRLRLRIVEERHEPEIHVQLLMAVEEGQTWIVGDKVKFELLESPEHHHVLDHARGRLTADAR